MKAKLAFRLRPATSYLVAALASIVLSIVVLHLWKMNLAVPLYYSRGSDELLLLSWVKALHDDGWIFTISHLGAPFAMSFGDYPVPNVLHLFVLRLLVLAFPDPAVATNVYFLLGFPIIALTATFALARIGFSRSIAVALGVAYAFLPMRFLRNIKHLFYSQYFMLPILALALFLVLRETKFVDGRTRRPTSDGLIFGIGLLLVALDNQYDALFCCIFLVFAAIASMIRFQDVRRGLAPAGGIAIVLAGLFLSVAPNIAFEQSHGKNNEAVLRPLAGAEVYGLTFAQLVLPIRGHRVSALSNIRAVYDSAFPPLVNENESASLGALGAAGFIAGIVLLLVRRNVTAGEWEDASRLNVVAFFLATVGGVGALLSYYYIPEVRAYNRISPLIAIFSFIVIACGLEKLRTRCFASRPAPWFGFLTCIVALAVLDQTSNLYEPAYAADDALYMRDGNYARLLESRLGPNAMIYQLPHIPFPESPLVNGLDAYDETALYIQSSGLRYSFGTTRGRPEDAWIEATNALPPELFLERLLIAGFDAISVYRVGYADAGAAKIDALTTILHEPPMNNADNTIATFDLRPLQAQYKGAIGSARAAAAAEEVIHPKITVTLGSGFYGEESAGSAVWSWAPANGTVNLANAGSAAAGATLNVDVATAVARPSTLTIDGPGTKLRTRISQRPTSLSMHMLVPPGESSVDFATDAPRLNAGADPRDIRFQLTSWSVVPDGLETAVRAAHQVLLKR